MRDFSVPLYPSMKAIPKPLITGAARTPVFFIKALLPTFAIIALAELVFRYTASGYSVVVIILLALVLYTAFRSGALPGVISALVVVAFNFYVISETRSTALFSRETLAGGGVIATAFPVLAFIIGRLKARNDALLRSEQMARLKAEESAEQLQFMAESMPQMIFTIYPSGRAGYINPQWNEYTGSNRKRMADWSKIVHHRELAQTIRLWKKSLKTGELFQIEHRLKRADGVYVWHLTRAHALRDAQGRIRMWIGSSTDIEDVRRARKLEADTARLIKQRTQLMELNKAKDEFISLASHQLRTPATGVKQYVNMALDGYAGKLSPQLRLFLEKANTSNERQLSVINDLLKVAQVDAGKVVLHKEVVNLDKLISNVLHDQRSMFDSRKQTVTYKHKRKGMTVRADPTKLLMIIENITDNASKYSYENTRISVDVTKYRGVVRISVCDQGVGIDPADANKVFDKFMRLNNPLSTKVGGNGLGLYWVKKVVELHGGTITVSSRKGKGATFTVALPVSAQ